jgi:ATP-dependent DNA helicase RecQ
MEVAIAARKGRFCETTSCGTARLFGECDHPPCGNWDNYLYPVASWYGTSAAEKALSAAYRTGQRFGAHHLVDVLVGNATARIRDLGHHRRKTFGFGTELDGRRWLSVIRQLLAQRLLLPDPDGHGGLALAPTAAHVLRGAHAVPFRQEVPRERGATAHLAVPGR